MQLSDVCKALNTMPGMECYGVHCNEGDGRETQETLKVLGPAVSHEGHCCPLVSYSKRADYRRGHQANGFLSSGLV